MPVRTIIKPLFFYFKVCLRAELNSLSCQFTPISFLTCSITEIERLDFITGHWLSRSAKMSIQCFMSVFLTYIVLYILEGGHVISHLRESCLWCIFHITMVSLLVVYKYDLITGLCHV